MLILIINFLAKLGFVQQKPGLAELTPAELELINKALDQYFDNKIYEFEGYQFPKEVVRRPELPDFQWFISGLSLRKKLNKVQKSFSF